MNTIWHLVRKDLLRARWLAVGWLVLTVLPVLAGSLVLAGWNDVVGLTIPFRAGLGQLVFLLQILIVFPIVAWVIHEDRVVGSRVHWVVLPISGRRLLAAKSCGLVLILWAMPLGVLLPWWLFNGFGSRELASALLNHSVAVLPATAVALALASLTDSLGRFTISCLAAYLGLMAISGALVSFRMDVDGTPPPPDVAGSRTLLVVLGSAVTLAAVVTHQFRRRKLAVSLCLLGAGASILILIAVAWRWGFPTSLVAKDILALDARPDITFDFEGYTLQRLRRSGAAASRASWLRFEIRVKVEGLRASELWTGRVRKLTFDWSDGTTASFGLDVVGRYPSLQNSSGRFLVDETAQGLVTVFSEGNRVALALGAELPEALVAKFAAEAPSATVVVEGLVHQGELLADLPLTPGARGGIGPHRVVIQESERLAPLEHRLVMVYAEPALPPWRSGTTSAWTRLPPFFGRRGVGLFNPSDRDAVKRSGRWGQIRPAGTTLGHYAGVALAHHRRIAVPPRISAGGSNLVADTSHGMDESWLDDARLVWTREIPMGQADTEFTIDQVAVPISFSRPFPDAISASPEPVVWPPDSSPEPDR